MSRLEVNVGIIAATMPALRPLWAKSARRNQKFRRQAHRLDDEQRLKPTYVAMDRADLFASRLETRATAHENEAPSATGIPVPSDASAKPLLNA